MNKFFSKYIILLFALLGTSLLTGCSDSADGPGNGNSREGMLTLSLRSMAPRSKAAQVPVSAADDPYNEFLVENVMLYFYKGSVSALDRDTEQPFYSQFVELDPKATTRGEVEVRIPVSKLNKADLADFCVYAVANLAADSRAGLDGMESHSVAAVKALVVGSMFDVPRTPQQSFVMDGLTDNIRTGAAQNSLTGEIELTRASAKISLNLSVPAAIDDNGVTYRSVTADMAVFMCNGVKTSAVGADAAAAGFAPIAGSLFNTDDAVSFVAGGTGTYSLSADRPFYSYPNNWRGTVTNDNRTYMLLCVPWQRVDAAGNPQGAQENYYYQVPVNIEKADGSNKATADMLQRNKHYIVNLTVGKLGSPNREMPEDVMEIDLSYTVMEWGVEDLNISLDRLRYLQVERDTYTMNNQTDISIPFVSSHDVEIVDANLRFKDYNTTNGTPQNYYVRLNNGTYTSASNDSTSYGTGNGIYTLSVEGNSVKFHHELYALDIGGSENNRTYPVKQTTINGVTSNQEAIGEFLLTFTLRHTDAAGHTTTQKVAVWQFPALYILVDTDSPRNTVYVNGTQGTNNQNWNYVANGGANNSNYNNYIINVTRFQTGNTSASDYIVGDARETTTSNVGRNNWSSQRYLNEDGTVSNNNRTRALTNYYPTAADAAHNMFIAPVFTVASSRGAHGTNSLNRDEARQRCAGYQENGRPGGRWRLPTYGEVKFIMELTAKGLIPRLFGSSGSGTSTYWTAYGHAIVGNGSNTTVSHTTSSDNSDYTVRCVYDEWYWGDNKIPDANKTTFFWGDRARK